MVFVTLAIIVLRFGGILLNSLMICFGKCRLRYLKRVNINKHKDKLKRYEMRVEEERERRE